MVHFHRLARNRRAAYLTFVSALRLASPPAAWAEPPSAKEGELSGPLDRATLVNLTVRRNPSVRAAEQRARAVDLSADADGSLPAPELAAQVWQVPFSRPYALNDSQMIMVGVSQSFPAPGSLGAKQAARHEEARVGEAMAAERARQVARDAEHAFADYVEAAAGHRIHAGHEDVARRILEVSRRRQAAGGTLTEVTQAEVELARVQADVESDAARLEMARGRINAVLGRAPAAPLGPPIEGDPMIPAWGQSEALAKARDLRPELRATAAERQASVLKLRAAEREATWPSFSFGVSYFAPTALMPFNGYGLNAGMSLPWLWGGATLRRDAQQQFLAAASSDAEGIEIAVEADVVTASSTVEVAAVRLQIERERVLPATKRAFDLAWGGYESGRTDLLTLLMAQRSVVDAEHDIVMSRAALDHALADLDAAVGVAVPRRPLPSSGKEPGHG
jgi:outer membrane protein, heavy metal efflux system